MDAGMLVPIVGVGVLDTTLLLAGVPGALRVERGSASSTPETVTPDLRTVATGWRGL